MVTGSIWSPNPAVNRAPSAVFLAFANDWVDDKRHLRSLLDESTAIARALVPLVDRGVHLLPPAHNATVDDIVETFQRHRDRDRIRVFHFGGHADGAGLLLEERTGQPAAAHASGLAGYLGRQPDLVLVFLNGCCTEPQVRQLRRSGVKAVVATTGAIRDEVAARFASVFYAELCARPLRDAFDTTVQAIRTHCGDAPVSVMRDVASEAGCEPHGWPWLLDCDPAFDAWNLGSEAAHERRNWRARAQWMAAIAAFTLIATATLSGEARRIGCRAPLLRSICARLAIAGVPTPAEQASWDDVQTRRSVDALRAHVRAFPTGPLAEEARARLDACETDRIETLGPERDVPYAWIVPSRPAHPLPTEDAARRDAMARGAQEATEPCDRWGRTAVLLSEQFVPDANPISWTCRKTENGFTCGVTGHIVCRVRDRVVAEQKRCW